MSSQDYNKLTVSQLRTTLTERGLDEKGKKNELIERLKESDQGNKCTLWMFILQTIMPLPVSVHSKYAMPSLCLFYLEGICLMCSKMFRFVVLCWSMFLQRNWEKMQKRKMLWEKRKQLVRREFCTNVRDVIKPYFMPVWFGLNVFYFISHEKGLGRAKVLCHSPLPHNGYTCIKMIIYTHNIHTHSHCHQRDTILSQIIDI